MVSVRLTFLTLLLLASPGTALTNLRYLPWPWKGREAEVAGSAALRGAAPPPSLEKGAAIPDYRPPRGVEPTYEDGLVRAAPFGGCWAPAKCQDVCAVAANATTGVAAGNASTACRPTCGVLMDQCCTFCLYSSFSVLNEGADNNASLRECIAQCPLVVLAELTYVAAPAPAAAPAPSPAPAPVPALSAPSSAVAPAPSSSPLVSWGAASSLPAPATAPAPAPVSAPALPPGRRPTPYPRMLNCTACLAEDLAAGCNTMYEECATNCLVAFADPPVFGTGRSRCLGSCSAEVCKNADVSRLPNVLYHVDAAPSSGHAPCPSPVAKPPEVANTGARAWREPTWPGKH